VTPAGQNPYKMWRLREGLLSPLLAAESPEPYNQPRQALPPVLWQTGHVDAMRRTTLLELGSMTGTRILPLLVDPRYAVDVDTRDQLALAEYRLRGTLEIVRPGCGGVSDLDGVRLVAFDFDGVFTDNRVYVNEDGHETVAASRVDGLGLAALRERGIQLSVISSERSPVVAARCRKLGLECLQGVSDKAAALRAVAARWNVPLRQTLFVGNDVNDLPALSIAGVAVVVADAHPDTFAVAHCVLSRAGGRGAVRELCDRLLVRTGEKGVVHGASETHRQAMGW
jgi:N-acylneuraminate cytidylyltransferase